MSNPKQKPMVGTGLYIALSLCVLAVVCIGAYTAVQELFSEEPVKPTQDPLPSESLSDVPAPSPLPPSDEPADRQPDTGEVPVTTPGTTEDEPVTGDSVSQRIFMLPTSSERISKGFNVESLLYSETMEDYRAHTGVDFAAEEGAPVYAFTNGTIETIHADPLMGQTVVIDHGDGLKSTYQNLALEIPEGIVSGTEVNAGDLIGAVGQTCVVECAEESHLHFEVSVDGKCVDPAEYLIDE